MSTDANGVVYDAQGNVIFDPGTSTGWDNTPPSSGELSAAQSFYQSIIDKANALDAQVQALNNMQVQYDQIKPSIQENAALLQLWNDNYNKISLAQDAINSARSAIQQVSDWWTSIQNALSNITGSNNTTLGNLGFIIAIPWGVVGIIAGAIAAIAALNASLGYGLNSFRQYQLQQTNIQRASQGLPPIADASPSTGGFLSSLGGNLGLILGAALVYFFLIKE